MASLRDSEQWISSHPAPIPFVKQLSPAPDAETVGEFAVDEAATEISTKKTSAVRAERFVSLVQAGATPGQAARAMGTTVQRLNTGQDMKAAIKRLMDVAHLAPEIKRAAVRAGLMKIFVENVEENPNLSIKAAKQMAIDPEMGMQELAPTVSIDMGPLADVLRDLTPIPGITLPEKSS